MIRTGLFLLVLLLSLKGVGQKYSFVRYSTEQGLPHSQVTAFVQDEQGYLWIGTIGGLAKFNGNRFSTYSANDGLLFNRITSLDFFDQTVWVGHDGGISKIEPKGISSIEFEKSGSDRSRNVTKIIPFNKKVLVCSNGGGLFELKNGQLISVPLNLADHERIRGAYVFENEVYLATKSGILKSSDGRSFEPVFDLENISVSGITGFGDEIVISTYTNGLYIRNIRRKQTRHIPSDQLKDRILGCYADRSNRIWLSSPKGVVRIDQEGEIAFFDDSNGLPVNSISCFYNDDADNVWIGSQGKGMFRFPNAPFRYFDQSTGLPSDLFLTGFQDAKGDYYLGTYDKGIVRKTKSGKIISLQEKSAVWASLQNINGSHWFGTGNSLIEMQSNGRSVVHTVESNPAIPGSKITALFRISDDAMYVGGNAGVSVYRNGFFRRLSSKKGNEAGTVRDFEIIEGELYCATNLGLLVYRNGDFQLLAGSNQVIYNLEKDHLGTLWYGTEEGLFRYREGNVEPVALFEDPASNFIDFMNFHQGKMFVGTNNGLFVLSNLERTTPSVKRFGIGDGIIDLETNLNSGFFDRKGNFWFGTASGLVCYLLQNKEEEAEKPRPKINMQSILLNYSSFDYSNYSEELDAEGFPVLLELPSKKNNLIFELDGVSMVSQSGLKYRYWLEGLRENWSEPSENASITFTNLPAGEYVLRAKSVDIDGRESDELRLAFVIQEAFYRSWWFIVLMAALIAGLTVLVFRLRIRRISEINEKEKLDYKAKLLALEQKSMNASMNRHFIFNSLNSIQYFINTQDKVSANKYLTNFAKLIRKNLDSVTAEGNVISLEEELERVQLYLSLESMRFKDRFTYEINTHGIDVESVLIPPMVIQPFIENSIMHGILPDESKQGKILVDVNIQEDYLVISIEDNGVGIHQSIQQKSGIAGDHKSQGMIITSKRIELIQKISDSGIALEGPEEIKAPDGSINGTRVLIKIPLAHLEI